MIPECRLSFWNKFIPSPYLSLYLFTFLSHTSHSTMSSRFSVRIKFSFWYKISFWYHVNWQRALFRIENRKRVLSGEWGMRIWSGAKTTRLSEPFIRYELHSGTKIIPEWKSFRYRMLRTAPKISRLEIPCPRSFYAKSILRTILSWALTKLANSREEGCLNSFTIKWLTQYLCMFSHQAVARSSRSTRIMVGCWLQCNNHGHIQDLENKDSWLQMKKVKKKIIIVLSWMLCHEWDNKQ